MNIVRSYKELRLTVGIIGMLLPFALMLWIYIAGEQLPDSISKTYYTSARNLFVGSLSAVALFMFFYNGYNKTEDWLGNFAGIFAIGVAFFPCVGATRPYHLISAALLFSVFAFFSFMFWKYSKKTIYMISFVTILLSMLILVIFGSYIYLLETVMLIAFGTAWTFKSKLIFK